jgi:hypothetical protein
VALFPCPECTRQVSDLAKSCPSCGRPFGDDDDHLTPEIVTNFLRTVVAAGLRPRMFLERWRIDAHRYVPPKRVLMGSALVAGTAVSVVFWLHPSGLAPLTEKIAATLSTLAVPWIAVVAFRLGGPAAGLTTDWRLATRLAAFKSAAAMLFLPVSFTLMLAYAGFSTVPLASAGLTATIALVYAGLAFRFRGAARGRALVGASVVMVLQVGLVWLLVIVIGVGVVLSQPWVPELRPATQDAGAP